MADPDIAMMLAAVTAADLITPGPDGLVATFLPLHYDPDTQRLNGHVARSNPHWKAAAAAADDGTESLVIVRGPDTYISPSWYASKAEHGRVVPTWNYETLHIYGHLSTHVEPDWLRALVTTLTVRHEAAAGGSWEVADAPVAFIDSQLRAIVGLSLSITRIEAKSKLSQNRPAADQAQVIDSLAAGTTSQQAVSAAMRRLRNGSAENRQQDQTRSS